jgi:hypothetical protein
MFRIQMLYHVLYPYLRHTHLPNFHIHTPVRTLTHSHWPTILTFKASRDKSSVQKWHGNVQNDSYKNETMHQHNNNYFKLRLSF